MLWAAIIITATLIVTDMHISNNHTTGMLTTSTRMLMVTMPTNMTVTRSMPIYMAPRLPSPVNICSLRFPMKTCMHTTTPHIGTLQITCPPARTMTLIFILIQTRIHTLITHIPILPLPLCPWITRALQYVAASLTLEVLPSIYPLMAPKSHLPFHFPCLPPAA